jgi:putative peptidoglycan lipid II flippase
MTAWQIATRAFYALQDTITPLKVGFIQIGIDIALLLTLPRIVGYRGLPLATAISMTIGFLILWRVLTKELKEIKDKELFPALAKAASMCIMQGLFLYAFLPFFERGHKRSSLKDGFIVFTAGVSSFLLYLLIGYVLRYPEISSLIKKLSRKIRLRI